MFYRETATVALWSRNAEAFDSKKWIDISSREHVVSMIMGCTYKKENCRTFLLFIYNVFAVPFILSGVELSASFGSQVCINV